MRNPRPCTAGLPLEIHTLPGRRANPGSNDLFARAIGQQLGPAVGQQVVVDNRPGANQMIAADIMAKSPADGHTIYITSTSFHHRRCTAAQAAV